MLVYKRVPQRLDGLNIFIQWEIFRIQQMELRKRTIFLAIWIVGIFPYMAMPGIIAHHPRDFLSQRGTPNNIKGI